MSQALIIGYGNPLRSDDGIGCRAARELEQIFRSDPDVVVIACQQLTPEMAEDVAGSQFVVFLDAALGEVPGVIQQTSIFPQPGPLAFTHHLAPSSLLSAAEELYGDAPAAMTITVTGWAFETGDELSPGAARCLPRLVKLARESVESYRRSAGAPVVARAK